MAQSQNRLEFFLTANSGSLEKSFLEAKSLADRSAKGMSDAFETASGKIEDSLESVEFAKVADEARASALAVKKTFDKTGDDLKKAFQEASDTGLPEGLGRAKKAASDFAASAKSDLASVKKAASDSREGFDDLADGIDAINLSNLVDQANDLGAGLKSSLDGAKAAINDAGDEVRQFESKIESAFSDTASQDVFIKKGKEIKEAYGEAVSLEEIGKAAQILDTLGAATPKNLERVAKVAKDVGRELDDIAEPLGEALASLESGNFDVGVFEELRSTLGVSTTALQKYGAELDKNNQLLTTTEDQQRNAQKALAAYIDTNERFANVADRGRDNISKAQDEVDKFNRAVGDQVNELKNAVAGVELYALKLVNELPDGFKTAGAAAAFLGGGVVDLALKLGQVVTVAKLAGVNLGGFGAKLASIKANGLDIGPLSSGLSKAKDALLAATNGAKAFAVGTGGSVLALAGLGIALGAAAYSINEYNKSVIDVEKAEQALQDTQSKAVIKAKDRIRYINLSAEAIRKETDAIEDQAEKRVALTKAILLKESKADDLRDSDPSQAGKFDAEVAALRDYRTRVDSENAKLAESEKKRNEDSRRAFLEYEKIVSRGEFDSKKAQLAELNKISVGLTGDTLREAKAARKTLNAEVLAGEVATLKEITVQRSQSLGTAKTQLAGLLALYDSNGQARKDVEKDFTAFVKSEENRRFQNTQKILADDLALRRGRLALKAQAAQVDEESIAALEGQLDAGKDVTKQLGDELTARAKKQKALLDEEATLDRIAIKQDAKASAKADPANATKIKEQAAERERQLDAETANKKAALDREVASQREAILVKQAKLTEDNAKKASEKSKIEAETAVKTAELRREVFAEEQAAQAQLFADRRRNLEEQATLGRDTSAELAQLAKDEAAAQEAAAKRRLDLAKQEIALKQKQANIGATKEQKVLNEQRAQLEVQQAQRVARQALQAIVDQDVEKLKTVTAELIKQRDVLKEQTDEKKKALGIDSSFQTGGYGLDQINDNLSGIGQSAFKKTEDGRSVADIEAEIARNQGILNSKETAERRKDSTPNTTPKTSSNGQTTSFGDSAFDTSVQAAGAPVLSTDPRLLDALAALLAVNKETNTLLSQQLSAARQIPSHTASNFTRSSDFSLG